MLFVRGPLQGNARIVQGLFFQVGIQNPRWGSSEVFVWVLTSISHNFLHKDRQNLRPKPKNSQFSQLFNGFGTRFWRSLWRKLWTVKIGRIPTPKTRDPGSPFWHPRIPRSPPKKKTLIVGRCIFSRNHKSPFIRFLIHKVSSLCILLLHLKKYFTNCFLSRFWNRSYDIYVSVVYFYELRDVLISRFSPKASCSSYILIRESNNLIWYIPLV